jgi:NmrA-like family
MSSSAPITCATRSALVFGASSEQGRAVLEGLVNRHKYESVHVCTRDVKSEATYLIDGIGATSVLSCDVQNPQSVRDALVSTNATAIFFVTTTDLPSIPEQTFGEYEVIAEFFHVLKDVYDHDRLPRHVVLSVHDNVQRVARELLESTGETWIEPLDDGSIVPHFSAKGKGGEYAVQYLKDTPDLKLTLITLPFLYSNFLGFFAPLPNEGRTQWMLTACFGNGSNKIDMMATSDLATIVRTYAMNTRALQ